MTVVIVTRLPPPIGGAEVFAKALAGRLPDLGVRVVIITHRVLHAPSADGTRGRTFRYRANDHAELLDRNVRIYPILHYARSVSGLAVHGTDPEASATDQLQAILRRERPDVLHSHWHSLLPEVTQAATAAGIPCVHTIHGLASLARSTRPGFGADQALALIHRRAHAIAVSRDVFAYCRRRGVTNVTLVHPGVDPAFFRPGEAVMRRDLLYVGKADRYKGAREVCEGFLEAAPRLGGRLFLVGRGMTREAYATHGCFLPPARRGPMRRLIEEGRVRFLGELPAHRLRTLYQRSRALLLPSLMEGFPLAILEALSCGTPVIASDVGSIADVVESGRSGFLIPKGNSRSLARALLALPRLEGPRLATRCRASARAFSLDRAVACHVRTYRRVVATARRSSRGATTIIGGIDGIDGIDELG